MTSYELRVITIAAFAFGSVLAGGCAFFAQPRPAHSVEAITPAPIVLAQTHPAPAASAVPAPPSVPAPPKGEPVGLPRRRDYERISELADIYFEFGKSVIRPGDVKILDANAAWLRANPGHLVLIEGHSDNRGATNRKNELNMDLGERRAQAAMNHLIARGVEASRITILSYGEERPQCAEQSERCWSQNRRSRFLVKPPR
jgi:peptidoglycan-associated lipoprotein